MRRTILLVSILLMMFLFASCDKHNDDIAVSPRSFDPGLDGIGVYPMSIIDSEQAGQIRSNKQAIMDGENLVPAIEADYRPAAATVARPAVVSGPAAPGGMPQGGAVSPAPAGPAVSYSSDPNGYGY